MNDLIAFWTAHGTKVLGVLATIQSVILALLTVPELIPVEHVKWWAASGTVLGVLTTRRGFENSQRQP
jgi:hypothetical protein